MNKSELLKQLRIDRDAPDEGSSPRQRLWIGLGVTFAALTPAGGLVGPLLAYLLFNNMAVSTLGANFTQVLFRFAVTPELVRDGLIIAVVIGMIGGFLPALRAARQPVTTALRAA